MRMIGFFDRGADMFPQNIAFDDGQTQVTYGEAARLSHRIGSKLRKEGLTAGAKVAVLSPNRARAFVCVLGAWRVDMVWVAINPYNAQAENIDLMGRFDVEYLFYDGRFAPEIETYRSSLPNIRGFVCIDGTATPSLDGWIADANDFVPEPDTEDPDAPAWILPTGGTTGPSRGVVNTNRSLETMIACFHAHMDFSPGACHLVAAPMTHGAGTIALPFFPLGGTNYLIDRAEPLAVMKAIDQWRITHLFVPPTVLYAMLDHPDVGNYDYSSLRHFIMGAAPVSTAKFREAIDVFGPCMTEVFGQAEAPTTVIIKTPRDYVRADGSINESRLRPAGRPKTFVQVGFMDDDGNLLGDGEPGEIVVRGNLVMAGYYNNPEATAAVSQFGWHHTGDIGVRDKDGYITIVDRKKDMIITGGFNVYPNEVEQVLSRHAAVQDCAVVGVPHEKWGEALKAVVELKRDHSVEPDELIGFCREQLSGIKTPKTIEIWNSLPRSPNGKVLRREVRRRFWENLERNI